jgi:hypothetical protein
MNQWPAKNTESHDTNDAPICEQRQRNRKWCDRRRRTAIVGFSRCPSGIQ